ncbi:prepilin peptidase [Yoonia sp. F2084L]|uniref:prepilin peptidase n=1 Tax=Yoonia sp. F2084L TaxID=2926419 RepID=UPI001FF257C2|nr:prepilin peptidase [Yoonia sp. F2084L]MCK0095336.1 prepilin peptidase [Yoonia sp. F2084L]
MTAQAAYWFLPVVIPIAFYISWTDMRTMKIKNGSNAALLLAFALLGPFAFGFPLYLWQWLHFPIVLIICMALWALRVMGAGDAKMIAAMAPFFMTADLQLILRLFAACLLGALVIHSIFRFTPLKKLAPDWESWHATRGDLRGGFLGIDLAFPKGFPLSMTLLFYLLVVAIYR